MFAINPGLAWDRLRIDYARLSSEGKRMRKMLEAVKESFDTIATNSVEQADLCTPNTRTQEILKLHSQSFADDAEKIGRLLDSVSGKPSP